MRDLTKLTRESVFRDTKTWYASPRKGPVSAELLGFCRGNAGRKILDYGCATGDYCLALNAEGFNCVGADTNEEYVKLAREKGVEACRADIPLPFADRSFDTVLLFEVLEHVQDPGAVLLEAGRVGAKNILVTVPNCGEFDALRERGLTYAHCLETDHRNFFSKEELERLLAAYFPRFRVETREPIWGTVGLPGWLRKPISALYRSRLIRPRIFYRLYAVIDLAEDK